MAIKQNTYGQLTDKQVFLLDMDGTFYLGDRILPGSLDFIETLKKKDKAYLFFTNNSSKNARSYVDKLKNMGCEIRMDRIITSGMVTAGYLKREYPGKRVYLMGTPLLAEEMEASGIRLVDTDPDVVVVGFDTTLTYEKLVKVCDFIREGAPFIATHPDINCPTETGFVPDCGAVCAAISLSTGVKPTVLGKPEAETVRYILHRTGRDRDELIYIGDRLYTDIALGRHGITTALVLSGESKEEDLAESAVRSDIVADRLVDLGALL